LAGFAVGEGVEGKLAGGLGPEFEEEAGAAAGVGVDGVKEAEPGSAVEVCGVGDGEEGEVEWGLVGGSDWRRLRDER
jgi:hypothetical protein